MNRKRTTDDQTEAIDLSAVLNAKAVVPTPEPPVRRPRPSRRPSRRQPTQALSLRVPFDDWVALCERAEELDLSRNALICEIIAEYLAHPDQFPIGD